jgi:tRNA dimethylallyltransferase
VDPVAALRIEPNNTRRVVRALEVIELTGRPFSATMPRRAFVQPTVVIGLRLPRETLDARIVARVERMWLAGLLQEVRALEAVGLRQGRTASKALGYAQALAQLDDELSERDAKDQTAAMTRRFARRQESWFGPDPRIVWLDAADPQVAAQARAVVSRAIRDNGAHG